MAERGCAGLVTTLVPALVLLAGCTAGGGATTPGSVRTAPVARADVSATVAASGALSAVGSVNLGFSTAGKLTSVRVKVGDRVSAGQLLATVDDTLARQSLAQARANLRAQDAGLERIASSTTVGGAGNTADQAERIVAATRGQVAATATADQASIERARTQLTTDETALSQARSGYDTVKSACGSAKSAAASSGAQVTTLSQRAQEQLAAGDTAGANETLAELNRRLAASGSTGSSSAATACTQILTAKAAVTAAKQRVVADRTAVVVAKQKKKVDAAAGRLSVRTAQQGLVTARNGLDSSTADRPHSLDQQQALVDNAEAAVRAAAKAVADTTLEAPADGTITVVNGARGELVAPSTGTTAQAPGSSAAIPGASTVTSTSGASRPGGTQFIVMSDVDSLQLVLPLEQSDAARVAPRQRVDVQVDAVPDVTVTGHVVTVAPSAVAGSGAVSYYATVALDRPTVTLRKRLKDGQTARGTVVLLERRNVLSVPNEAVHRDGETTTVSLLAADGSQHEAPFEAGSVGAARTEVRSGLNEGQQVVIPDGGAR